MAEILIFSENNDLAFELVSKGKEFGAALNMQVAAALLGDEASAQADEYFAYGADKVYVGQSPALADTSTRLSTSFHAETFAEAEYAARGVYDPNHVSLKFTRLWLATLNDREKRQLIAMTRAAAAVKRAPSLLQQDAVMRLQTRLGLLV